MFGTSCLLSSLPLKSGILLFGLDHALIVMVRVMTVYRIVYMLKVECKGLS
jgi:hypothetical protein